MGCLLSLWCDLILARDQYTVTRELYVLCLVMPIWSTVWLTCSDLRSLLGHHSKAELL